MPKTNTKSQATEEVQRILETAAKADRELYYEESLRICQATGISPSDVGKEVKRTRRALKLQAVSGTLADHEKQRSEVERCCQVEAEQKPTLEKQIADLQKKVNAIERDRRLAEKRLHEMEAARESLKLLAPVGCRETFNRLKREANVRYRKVANDAQVEVNLIKWLGNLNRSSQNDLAGLQLHKRELVAINSSGRYELDAAAFDDYLASQEARLPELQEIIQDQMGKYDEAIAEAESHLDYYCV